MSEILELKIRLAAVESELHKKVSMLEARMAALEIRTFHGRQANVQMHKTATVDPSVTILGTAAVPSVIGAHVKIYRDSELIGRVKIGDGTFINRSAYLRDLVSIGENVNLGPFVRMLTDGHDIGKQSRRAGTNVTKPIEVGDGAWIGAAATILGGVSIGSGSIVAAGSVVTKDVPPNAIVAGVPARIVRGIL